MNPFTKISSKPDIFFIPLPKPSDYVYLDVHILDAVFWEDKNNIGLTHFLEHCICETLLKKFGDNFHFGGRVSFRDFNLYFKFKKPAAKQYLTPVLETILKLAKIDPAIFKKEQKVIADEISNSEKDTTAEIALLGRQALLKKPERLRQTILGDSRTVASFTEKDALNFWTALLRPDLVKIFVGDTKLDRAGKAGILKTAKAISSAARRTNKVEKAVYAAGRNAVIKNWAHSSKLNTEIYLPGLKTDAPKKSLALGAALRLLTGRSKYGLFKETRDLGVYRTYWNNVASRHYGITVLGFKLDKTNFRQTMELAAKKIVDLKKTNVPRSKIQDVFNLEDIKSRWEDNATHYGWVAGDLLNYGRVYKPKEVIAAIKSLGSDDIKAAAKLLGLTKAHVVVLGENAAKHVSKEKILSLLK